LKNETGSRANVCVSDAQNYLRSRVANRVARPKIDFINFLIIAAFAHQVI